VLAFVVPCELNPSMLIGSRYTSARPGLTSQRLN
jgi:hypothetical protein